MPLRILLPLLQVFIAQNLGEEGAEFTASEKDHLLPLELLSEHRIFPLPHTQHRLERNHSPLIKLVIRHIHVKDALQVQIVLQLLL